MKNKKNKIEELKSQTSILKQEAKDLNKDLKQMKSRYSGRISLTVGGKTLNLF